MTEAGTGANDVTLPHAFSTYAIGVVSRVTRNYSSSMTNESIAFPNQNLSWIRLHTGSNTTETLHWIVVGW